MKLVDADKARECVGGDGVTGAVMQRMFDSLPTIDAVPVVRCRDCKWFNHYTMECESDDVATDHEGGCLLMQSALTAAETAEMEDAEISSTAPPVAGREKSRVPKMT